MTNGLSASSAPLPLRRVHRHSLIVPCLYREGLLNKSINSMEFPDLGAHCGNPDCEQLDFLPIKSAALSAFPFLIPFFPNILY